MTNDEFQKIVLEELKTLKEGQRGLEKGQNDLEKGQKDLENGLRGLEDRLKVLEDGQRVTNKALESVIEQTADLTEFREEVNSKLETNFEENQVLKGIAGEHEVDIRTIKRLIV